MEFNELFSHNHEDFLSFINCGKEVVYDPKIFANLEKKVSEAISNHELCIGSNSFYSTSNASTPSMETTEINLIEKKV